MRAMKTDLLLPALHELGAAVLALLDTVARTLPTLLEALLRVAGSFTRLVHALLDCMPPH